MSIGRDPKGTVTLNRAADAGGVLVVLSSSNTGIAKVEPSTITIPQGSSTGTFDIRAFGETGSGANSGKITQATTVIIEAKISGTGRAAALTVEP